MILGRVERDRGLAVAQRQERGLLAGQEFLDEDVGSGRTQPARHHHVDGGLRFFDAFRHHHTLAGREAVGLDHDRGAFPADMSLGGRRHAEARIFRGRDRMRAAQVLGESLRAFEPCRRPPRPERLDPHRFEIVDDPGHQRPFGPHHDEIDPLCLAKIDHRGMVGRIERDELGVPGDPGVSRGAIEPVDQRTAGDLPGQRMLAPAGPEQKQVHGIPVWPTVTPAGVAWGRRPATDERV